MTELSEHLRWLGRLVRADYETYCGRPADAKHACELAADRIEALEAECAQLRDKTIDLLNTGTEAMIALVKRAETAEAECARLRWAITEAIKLLGMDRPINPSNILRAALEDQSHA